MPINMDGSLGPQAHKVHGFIKRLRARLPEVPIESIDERLTSAQAHRALSEEGVTLRRRAERVDRMAAQLILARYLNRRRVQQRADEAPGEEGAS
jgi:putative Holliday junction resolvase